MLPSSTLAAAMSPQRATQVKTEGICSGLFGGLCLRFGNCGASRHGHYDAAAVIVMPGLNAELPVYSTALENTAHKSRIWGRVKVSEEYGFSPGAEGWPPLLLSLSRFAPSAASCASIVPNEQALDGEARSNEGTSTMKRRANRVYLVESNCVRDSNCK